LELLKEEPIRAQGRSNAEPSFFTWWKGVATLGAPHDDHYFKVAAHVADAHGLGKEAHQLPSFPFPLFDKPQGALDARGGVLSVVMLAHLTLRGRGYYRRARLTPDRRLATEATVPLSP